MENRDFQIRIENRRFQIGKFIDFIGGIMFLSMILLTIFNRTSSWLLNRSYGQIEEFVLAAFVWVSYVGMGELYKSGEHISVDLLEKSLPVRSSRILRIFIDLVVLAVSVIVVYFAVILTIRSTTKYTAVLKIPYFYIDIAVVIGFASTVVYAIRRIVKTVGSYLKREGAS